MARNRVEDIASGQAAFDSFSGERIAGIPVEWNSSMHPASESSTSGIESALHSTADEADFNACETLQYFIHWIIRCFHLVASDGQRNTSVGTQRGPERKTRTSHFNSTTNHSPTPGQASCPARKPVYTRDESEPVVV
ncbi:hypothetical protein WN48_04430 [Eufriesea mexicana]|uniref:Uncharacterized protein n=1 Tax=Eufriesea mexicana TaxID=516756 RepID=A0A310SM36_9HYME|nr:hypothetical protein WN48_04430 [Eufriesea mexicana]